MARLFSERFRYRVPADLPPRDWHRECAKEFRQRWGSHAEGQFSFMVNAGTGSGKTYLAGYLAQDLLNRQEIDRLVYVCPNRIIAGKVCETFRMFDIVLSEWDNGTHTKKGDDGGGGEGVATQGAIMTYQSLSKPQCWKVHKRIAERKRTLVVFDEIHHLGDRQSWAEAAKCAFEADWVPALAMSGTPFRSDARIMPIVRYDKKSPSQDLWYLCCDYIYSLGRAVAEGVCKRPVFVWLDGSVQMDVGAGSQIYNATNPPSEEYANVYLGAAVRHGSVSRIKALEYAITRCRNEGRKLIIFVGGDTRRSNRAVEDARSILPAEILSLGLGLRPEDIVSVTSSDEDAKGKISRFGKSDASILITVNMISEGVDIPELSAALFLTNITATSTTIQRIGRTLRGCMPPQALIFMFWHPQYVKLAEAIEKQIAHELRLRDVRRRATSGNRNGAGVGIEAVGIDAREHGLTVNGRTHTQDHIQAARQFMAAHNYPNNQEYLTVVLDILYPAGGKK